MAEETKTMSMIRHLEEFRKRLIICLIALTATSVAGFLFVDNVRRILVKPAGPIELIYITPPEALMVNIRLAILTGIMLAMPVFIYQFLAFIMPALYKNEKKIMIPILFAMIVMFGAGVFFAYKIAFPFAITFFLQFASADLIPMFTITQYTSFATQFILTFGIVFQLPLLFLFLGMINVVDAPLLRKIRKYVVLVIFVVAAVITPPDIISQLMIAVPLCILYEFGIILVMIVQINQKRRRRQEEVTDH